MRHIQKIMSSWWDRQQYYILPRNCTAMLWETYNITYYQEISLQYYEKHLVEKFCNIVRNNHDLLLQFLIKKLKTKMKVTITQVSTLGSDEGHNNEQEHNTDEFPNIGSIRRNVRLPFLFNYNQKKQEISWKRQWKFIWTRSLERNIEQKKVISWKLLIKEFNFCIKVK